jgi:hypothetical protein
MPTSQLNDVNNVCNSQAYLNLVDQRKRMQLTNVPPPRYDNLANNPYTKINPSTGVFYTNFDLAMRRKAEILKYSNNTSSTKTNNLTKAQKWAQLVNGNSSSKFSQAYVNSKPTLCPAVIVQTPSTASDVPGPAILLYEDDNVPVYNLINDILVAPFGVEPNTANNLPWQSYPRYDALSIPFTAPFNSLSSVFNTINMPNPELNALYTFSVSIPFTIYLEADVVTNIPGEFRYTDANAVQIWVSQISLGVFYSSSQIQYIQTPTYSFSKIVYTSAETAMNIAADVSINIQSTDPSYNKFYAHAYGGVIQIDNIVLRSQPGYIYDMQLAVDLTIKTSQSFTTFFGGIPTTYYTYLNTSYATTQYAPVNCTVTNPYPITETSLPKFTITGGVS